MNRPFFSILVPTFNQSGYLGAALDSLLSQTDPDWEAIVVNDGSTDATADVLMTYSILDKRFRVVHQPNGGVGSALNAGLRLAQGKWVCWLSSDDLFQPGKLATHRAWIVQHPECRFFFTHFHELDETRGKIINPPLWAPIPAQAWQVLEMLRANYVHGNSICVDREGWSAVGGFNEELRHGQDYDMWLRLIVRFPAVFIPERTCVTRIHRDQGTNTFPRAGFYDSAKAAIRFLNSHPFADLISQVDRSDPGAFQQALVRALDIAGSHDGFLYKLGPHPALLMRVMEWLWGEVAPSVAVPLRQVFRSTAQRRGRQYDGTSFGLLWKAAALAGRLAQNSFQYQPVAPPDVGLAHYHLLRAAGLPEAKALGRYLERFENIMVAGEGDIATGGEVVFIAKTTDGPTKLPTEGVPLALARHIQRSGRPVMLMIPSAQRLMFETGVVVLGLNDDVDPADLLAELQPIDVLIDSGYRDTFTDICARRRISLGADSLAARSVLEAIVMAPVHSCWRNIITSYLVRQYEQVIRGPLWISTKLDTAWRRRR
jgi:GT2 family glycosyltransferase